MNEPNVPMYRNDITQVCLYLTTAICSFGVEYAADRLFMNSSAAAAAMTARPAYSQPARDRLTASPALTSPNAPPAPTTIGRKNWMIETPRLPPAALRPNAEPLSRAG